MHTLRRRISSRVLLALLASLLLVPLLVRAHAHGTHHASGSCGTCVAAHHATALADRLPTPPIAAATASLVASAPRTLALEPDTGVASERGPPKARGAS